MAINLITKAARIVGSRVALARLIGVSKGAIWQYEHEREVPAKRCRMIEEATGGRVSAKELRPDIFGDTDKSKKKSA